MGTVPQSLTRYFIYMGLCSCIRLCYANALLAQQRESFVPDSDQDGFPDAVELTSPADRLNFRRWFTFIAELQFYRPSERWSQVNYDCAGLVRYAFVEALKKHTLPWHRNMGLSELMDIPDVKKYHYPQVPVLGVKVFSSAAGFGVVADAYQLMAYNTVFLGKEEEVAQKGDLLFFLNENNPNMPYHVMIFVGKEEGVSGGQEDWLVYHTGPDKTLPGEVRKVQRSLLKQHPNPTWRPVLDNPRFLGYFRWKILD